MYSWVMLSMCAIHILSVWFPSWDLSRNCAFISYFICEDFDFLLHNFTHICLRRDRALGSEWKFEWYLWGLELRRFLSLAFEYGIFEVMGHGVIIFYTLWYDSFKWQTSGLNVWLSFHWFLLVCYKYALTNLLASMQMFVGVITVNPQETQLLLLGTPRGLKACCTCSMQSFSQRKWSS